MTETTTTPATTVTADDDAAIRAVVEARAAAMRRGDAAALVAQYLPGAVVFSLAPPLVQDAGGARAEASLRAWFDQKGGSVASEVRDVQVHADGDIAFVSLLEKMGDPAGSFELWFRTTLGLRRVDGGWRLAHEHTSTPFHMDGSFRAATDLRP